jgi:hypothetical protein
VHHSNVIQRATPILVSGISRSDLNRHLARVFVSLRQRNVNTILQRRWPLVTG